MDALKALKEKLKKEKQELAGTKAQDKKYVTKAEIEAAKLLKIRGEEEREAAEKGKKRQVQDHGQQPATKQAKHGEGNGAGEKVAAQLPKQEVIRRLRALGQPATLFGEDEVTRLQRLLKAEKEMQVEDEALGGQQENILLELQREKHARHKAAAAAAAAIEEEKRKAKVAGAAAPGDAAAAGAESGAGGAVVAAPAEDPVHAAFAQAAARLAEKRAEEAMCVEDRIAKWVKKWEQEWEEDLERRPDEIKNSGSGHQTTLMFRQTKKYFEPLYERLKQRNLHEELRAGLWMMISAMRERNYLQANDIYLKLAIGNSPWPIGVTQVGIHERSAREKISHVMNQSGMAHIMNDEATRKYFQAFKRMITFVQRAYPTDPSRSVNFQTGADLGRGVGGAGSDKLALLEAEAKGEDWRTLGLEDAPHFLEKDGSVQVPTKWAYILGRAQEALPKPSGEGAAPEGGSGAQATGNRT